MNICKDLMKIRQKMLDLFCVYQKKSVPLQPKVV